MPLLQWADEYSVRIGTFDAQHKILFELINNLHDAMAAGKSKTVLQDILKKLVDYTKAHFAAEEQLLSLHKYPELAKHVAEHDALRKRVSDFSKALADGQAAITMDLMEFLRDWLKTHIQGSDKQYSSHLRSRGVN